MFSYTRRHRTQPQRFALTLSVLTSLLTSLLLPSIAHAAPGFGTVSVKPDSGIITINAATELTLNINAQDVALFSVSLDASLTNATLESYDCSTSSFSSVATVINGGVGVSSFTVVASYQADQKAEATTDLTICRIAIKPTAEGAVTLALSNVQAFEAGDETPTPIPTQATTVSYATRSTEGSSTSADTQPTLPTTTERTNKSIIPGDSKVPRVVTEAELTAVRTAPITKSTTISTRSMVIGAVILGIFSASIGSIISRHRMHKKFIRTHGMEKYSRYLG